MHMFLTKINDLRVNIIKSPVGGRYLSGVSWSLASSVLSQGLMLTGSLFVARTVGGTSYGQFVFLQSTLAMVGVFAGFGVGNTASRYIAAFKGNDLKRLGHILQLTEWTVVICSIVMSLALMFGAPLLSDRILGAPSLAQPLIIAAGAILFVTIDGFYKSALIGFGAMRSFAWASISGSAVCLPLLIWAGHLKSLNGLASALLLGAMIQSTISFLLTRKQYREFKIELDSRNCFREWRILRDFAFPAMLAGAMIAPTHWIVQTILARIPNGYNEIGLLGIAMQWFNMVLFLPVIAGRVVTPMLTEYVANGRHQAGRNLLKLAIGTNAAIAIPVAVIMAAASPFILPLYGRDFAGGSITPAVAVATASLLAVLSPVGAIIAAMSRMWLGMMMNLGWAIFYITGAYFLRSYGAAGVVLALAFAYIIHSIWTVRFAVSQLKS
jgi:EPS I polysaccharide export inner membrane protein EpsE